MLSLPKRLGLGLKIFAETAEDAYKDSTRIASNLRAQILGTNKKKGKTRDEIKTKRERRNQQKLRQFLATSDEKKPSPCICGALFHVTHALYYKKGGFMTLRHSEVRDITSELLDEVCVDVRKTPILQESIMKIFHGKQTKVKKPAFYISALNF